MKKFLVFLCGIALVSGLAGSAQALILNTGADIQSNGTYTPVTFFNGTSYGFTLNPGASIDLSLDTASVFGLDTYVTWADLFVDGVFVEPDDSSGVAVQLQSLGPLQDVAPGSSERPVETGGRELDPGQQDGSFFDLSSYSNILCDLATDDTFLVSIMNTGDTGDFRVDGINIQANVEPVPEPATMLLLGSGLIGLAGLGRRKFFKKA